jgi:succinate dehydrogenase/fumarate reductase-like Fe-S protein
LPAFQSFATWWSTRPSSSNSTTRQALSRQRRTCARKERLQSPEDRDKLDGSYECILCGCSPANALRRGSGTRTSSLARCLVTGISFISDSRDRATQERLDDLHDPYRLFRCRTIMNCTEVCPRSISLSGHREDQAERC